MKKVFYLLLVFSVFNVFNAQSVFAQEEEKETEKETGLTVGILGEVDASIRNHNGDRFTDYNHSVSMARIPSFDIWAEYKLNKKWSLNAEVEFISETGIQVDEISISHHVLPQLSLKGGMFMLPVGHCNSGHGYIDYLTTGDPEGEYALIPCPYIETGLAATGEFDCGINYFASITTGMKASNASPYKWMYAATQGFFSEEANFNSPAYTFKLGYDGIEGLSLNAGIYYCGDIARNMSYYNEYSEFCAEEGYHAKKSPIKIWFAEAKYDHDYFTARASYLQGHMGGTKALSSFLCDYTFEDDDEEFELTEGRTLAKGVVNYMGEVGLNLKNCFYPESKGPDLMPFVHYEYYDSQHEFESRFDDGSDILPQSKVNAWTFGCNWRPNDNIVVKANYTTRKIGGKNDNFPRMNELNLGIAYDFEF